MPGSSNGNPNLREPPLYPSLILNATEAVANTNEYTPWMQLQNQMPGSGITPTKHATEAVADTKHQIVVMAIQICESLRDN